MHDWNKEQESDESSNAVPIKPQALAKTVSDAAMDDAIICCDTGAVTVWTARHFKIKGSQLFTLSGGLASMAFGLPAAIGAQLLYPDRQVIAMCGDGGFAMLMADFATAVKYELPIKVFVFNNSMLGMIKAEQEIFAGHPEYQTDLHNPDYAAFAIACGGAGYTVKEFVELEQTIVTAMHNSAPTIVNVLINKEQINWPPEIGLGDTANYVKAKIKELFVKH